MLVSVSLYSFLGRSRSVSGQFCPLVLVMYVDIRSGILCMLKITNGHQTDNMLVGDTFLISSSLVLYFPCKLLISSICFVLVFVSFMLVLSVIMFSDLSITFCSYTCPLNIRFSSCMC